MVERRNLSLVLSWKSRFVGLEERTSPERRCCTVSEALGFRAAKPKRLEIKVGVSSIRDNVSCNEGNARYIAAEHDWFGARKSSPFFLGVVGYR